MRIVSYLGKLLSCFALYTKYATIARTPSLVSFIFGVQTYRRESDFDSSVDTMQVEPCMGQKSQPYHSLPVFDSNLTETARQCFKELCLLASGEELKVLKGPEAVLLSSSVLCWIRVRCYCFLPVAHLMTGESWEQRNGLTGVTTVDYLNRSDDPHMWFDI